MKKFLFCMIIIVCIALISNSMAAGFSNNTEAIEKAAKSVLKIYVYEKTYDKEPFATGSGFVAFNNSTLITNYHVIDGAAAIIASDDDNNTYQLDIVLCADKETDIAILEFSEQTNLMPLELYADDQLKRGTPVVAIGSPKGLKNTVSTGIVSYQYVEDGISEIQITAPISPGSSGGALFNDDGKVIGVTSAIYKSKDEYGENTDAQNLNFAVNIGVAQAMYNAWDGTKTSINNHKSSAPMDYTGVYQHINSEVSTKTETNISSNTVISETWICPNCGKENTTKFCLDCGAEKPYWVCICGKENSSNKFCGECGRNHTQIIDELNAAIEKASENDFTEAISLLKEMGSYNSGSYETTGGNHVEAKKWIEKLYYEQGIYLQENNGDHDDILDSFKMAGEYSDAKDQINGENARYKKQLYDQGMEYLKDKEYEKAIESFLSAGEYLDASEQIFATYYAQGMDLLENQNYEASREAFISAGTYQDASIMILRSYYDEATDKAKLGEYDSAIEWFTKAGDYSDSKEQIKGIYYIEAEEALTKGELESAKSLFEQAGDYLDSTDKILIIEEGIKQDIYNAGVAALENKEYNSAIEQFQMISGYLDADALLTNANISNIEDLFDKTKRSSLKKQYIRMMKQYINENERALIIYKRMNYDYGKELLEKEDYEIAIGYLTQADDYNNSAELLLETRINLYKKHINRGEYTEAVQLYNQFLASTGIIQEYFLMDIGDQGEIITEIFNLARALGYEIPKNEKIYQERYVKNIQKLEDHFGFKADGRITCSEYVTIHNMIYVGKSGSNIQAVLEQLADLSYMEKLPEKHTTYETKYVNSVKKAERKLGLQEDGIITENEYKVIMRQYVEVPAQVENLKVSVNKDTVTISWSKVTGAVCYEIRCDDVFLGTTEKTNWVDKDVETGTYKFYKVIAKKYSKASLASTKGITIPKYYYSVGLSELTKNSNSYKGKYVKLSNLTISNWYVSDSKGEHVKSSLAISTAQKYDNYNVNFICKAGEHYVWIIMENYKGWDWEDTQNDILGKIKRITNISVSGKVESTMLTVESKKMVKVVIDEISWRFR